MLWIVLESLAHANADGAVDFSIWGIWLASGTIARIVIVTLMLMFFGSIIVSIERLIAFIRSRSHSVKVAGAVVGAMKNYDVEAAAKIAGSDEFRAGHLTHVLRAGFAELNARPDEIGIQNTKRALDKKAAEELAKLKRWFGLLASVGSTAPFVGLAGTTMGVINAFQGMAGDGGAGLAGIASGISEALITTFIGIVVAIVGVWLFNFFNGWLEKVADELHTAQADFLNWATTMVADGGPRSTDASDASDASDEAAMDTDETPATGSGEMDAEPAPAGK
ncbi:MAG: biopolymer transport protein TolQ [Kiritimatiellia bacterium]|jgi:biopolymer transport protein TolQ